jgi:ABC-type multidrug transport system fused ATPase/permease subunit
MEQIALMALYMNTRPGGLAGALPVLRALALGAQRLLPLMQLIYTGRTQLVGNRQVLQEVLDLLEAPIPEEYLPDTPREPVPFEKSIALKNVWFAYDSATPVLRNLNFTIRKGAKVGFIGKTGSGKSTTIDLIMGLLEPTKGSVQIDGKALNARTRRGWQQQIAHVPQAIFLSDSSIAENIAFGVDREKVDMDRVREAARKAALAVFSEAMPQQYDTAVGERGVRLSGGQRQRIGIARALYKRASVLVFDEATSALDNQTESAVMEAIAALGRDLTVILIAHRLSTVAVCDEVIRLEAGEVADKGDYEQVVLKAQAS